MLIDWLKKHTDLSEISACLEQTGHYGKLVSKALFMPAMTARNNNPLLKEFGDRLQKNSKNPKQIIIAIMRKLLHQIYGVLKSHQPFNPNKKGFITAPKLEEIRA